MAKRHHAAHPPTAVKPNVSVNPLPETYAPTEAAAMPPATEVNPCERPDTDAVNARQPRRPLPFS